MSEELKDLKPEINETVDETTNEAPITGEASVAKDSLEKEPEAPEEKDITPIEEDYDIAEDDDDKEDYNNEEVIIEELSPFWQKVKNLPEKTAKLIQLIYGIFCGIVAYAAICIVETYRESADGMLMFGVIAVIVLLFAVSYITSKKTKWRMQSFRLGLIIGLAAAIVAFVIYLWAIGQPIWG